MTFTPFGSGRGKSTYRNTNRLDKNQEFAETAYELPDWRPPIFLSHVRVFRAMLFQRLAPDVAAQHRTKGNILSHVVWGLE